VCRMKLDGSVCYMPTGYPGGILAGHAPAAGCSGPQACRLQATCRALCRCREDLNSETWKLREVTLRDVS
jgi:hypothetical protein